MDTRKLNSEQLVNYFNQIFKVDKELVYDYEPFTFRGHPHLYTLKAPAYLKDGEAFFEVNEWGEPLKIDPGYIRKFK